MKRQPISHFAPFLRKLYAFSLMPSPPMTRPLRFILRHHRQPSLFFHICRLSTNSSRRHEDESRNVRVSVWWDLENCIVPAGINVFKVAHNITSAIRANGMKGPVRITAFGDSQQLSRSHQEALSATGVILSHVPNGSKGGAGRALLMDLMTWVSRNPPPAHLLLISGDRGFAETLHRLRMNNYNILLASLDNPPEVLCSAASIMWHWSSLIRGEDLVGKLYNQPPDGPYGSWYGHYQGPLEDPFTVHEQMPMVKNEDPPALEPMTELNSRPIPDVVMRAICRILKDYPKGISIIDLRDELNKKFLNIDSNFYGYKRFSKFLMSMPHILELEYQHSGMYLVFPSSAKSIDSCDSVGDLSPGFSIDAAEAEQRTSPDTKVESGEGSALKNDKVKSNAGIFTETKMSTDQNGVKLVRAVDLAPSQQDTECFERVVPKDIEEDPSHVNELVEPEPHVGFFNSILRRWFEVTGRSHPNPESEDLYRSADGVGQEKVEVANIVSKGADLDNLESSSSLSKDIIIKEQVSEDSRRIGFFPRIVSWFKFQETDSDPKPFMDQSNEEAVDEKVDSSAKDCIFSQKAFWSDMRSFLSSPQGVDIVFSSRTRATLAQNMRKGGPAILGTLREADLLHLVNVLISEKQLLEENTAKMNPFRLTKLCFPGSKGRRSIYSNKQSEHEGETKVHKNIQTGFSSSPNKKRNYRNKIL